MLDGRKIKLMTELALYEQTYGKEDFKISEYYRKDYVGMHMVFSFLWITVGYACMGAVVVLAGLEKLMEDMSFGFLVTLGIAAVVGYLFVLIIYLAVTNRIYNKKHKKARQRIKRYNHTLTRLLKIYEKENR